MILDDDDKGEVAQPATPKKKAARRGRPPKKKAAESTEDVENLKRRLADVETKLAAHNINSETCHMCHQSGATTQRGNTGEFFHGPCLADYRQGKDPLPIPEAE
jgi:cytochrome c5